MTEQVPSKEKVSDRILSEAIDCCRSWEPEVRLIGNVRAIDLRDLLLELWKHRNVPSKDQLPVRACRPWQEPSAPTQADRATVEPPQQPSKERVAELLEFWSEQLEVSMRMDGARHMRGDAMRDTIAVLKQLQSTHEPRADWWCETCRTVVAPDMVTYDETHDLRYGGCGQHVFVRAAQPPSGDVQMAMALISEVDCHLANAKWDKNATARRKLHQAHETLRLVQTKEVKP